MKTRLGILTMILCTAVVSILCLQQLYGCGPFFDYAIFTYTTHPDFPLDIYAKGNMGVVQPTYARSYLVVAYRYLAGTGFSQNEQKELVALWDERLHLPGSVYRAEYMKEWQAARDKVPNSAPSKRIDIFRAVDDNSSSFSQQAFQFLHKNYPKSPWTKKTPYWY